MNVKVLQKSNGQRAFIESFTGSLDEKHRNGREEVSSAESLDESDEETVPARQIQRKRQRLTNGDRAIKEKWYSLDSSMTRNVNCGERANLILLA